MKKILIPISNSFFVRNFLRTDFLSFFGENVRFIFLAPSEKLAYYQTEFVDSRIRFVATPRVHFPRIEKIFRSIEIAMIPTHTVYMMHQFHFHRRGTQQSIVLRLPVFISRMCLWCMGRFRMMRELFRCSYRLVSEPEYAALLVTEKPDIVFCPTMVYGSESILLREAKRLGIGTVGMTSSWDNLYSKTLLRVKPDQLLLQTELMKSTAHRFCDFPQKNILVTGVPQYDRYFKDRPVGGREAFISALGGDPNKKTILYAFSGKVTAELDMAVTKLLAEHVRQQKFSQPVQLLIRPYPKRDFSEKKVANLRKEYGVLIKQSVTSIGNDKNAWEFDQEALRFLSESLAYSDIVVTACSTFLVETAVFDKPIISIGFDVIQGVDYWNSARRFFDWDHLADLKKASGVRVVKWPDELFSVIDMYLDNPLTDASGRKAIVEQQCTYLDGRSVTRVAKVLSSL